MALPAPAAVLTAPKSAVTIARNFRGQPSPKWDRGYLLSFDFEQAIVYAHDRSGREVLHARLLIPDASRVIISDVAASPSGGYVVSAGVVSATGALSPLLIWLDPSGDIARVTRTAPAYARRIRFADDGTLWALVRVYDDRFHALPDHDLIRRYDRNGTLTGSFVPRTIISAAREEPAEVPFLVVSRDRVGFYADVARVWAEVSLDGRPIGQWKFPAPVPGTLVEIHAVELTSANDVLVEAAYSYKERPASSGIYTFDRAASSLSAVDSSRVSKAPLSLLGVDGNDLVLRAFLPGAASLLWVGWDK